MPASLESISLRGIRSYSPQEYKTQKIDFMPLTLIVGDNGSGKTTLIESLKFMISGEEPPLSDSRRNFLHMGGESNLSVDKKGAYGMIKLEFTTARDEKCVAKREIYKPGSTKNATPSVSSSYRIGNRPLVQVHKQDDWLKSVPKLFNLPNQALLNNVILCHQENSLWCMSDSSTVKQIFDKIFGCEQYKKEIKHIDTEMKTCKSDLALAEKDLIYLRDKIEQMSRLEMDFKKYNTEIQNIDKTTAQLDVEIKESTTVRSQIEDNISKSKRDTSDLEDNLLNEARKLSRSSADLQATCQGLVQRIKVKENYVKRLSDQLTQTDPIAKDLAKVTENLSEMSFITSEMEVSLSVDSLNKLIDESEQIVNRVMSQVKTGNIAKIKADIIKEESEIETSRTLLKTTEVQREEMSIKLANVQAEHEKVRSKSKDSTSGQEELNQIESKLMNLRDKRSRLTGSKNQMQRDIMRIKAELDQLSKTKSKFAESLGKVVCSKIIISDLEKLKNCFENSIMSFHDQMIKKINEVLHARWRQIYQGKDIERIELVDEEITKGKDKKSYNYYIAMRKGGVRMKMREKSSAGQRALASIILRMTLAELFVKDFAFIGLDEPTANLDVSNVKALAKSIAAYVKRRSKKGINIQWIIITHDEHFLRAIDEECSPFYYNLELDDEGCTKINKISSKVLQYNNGNYDTKLNINNQNAM